MGLHEDVVRMRAHIEAARGYAERVRPELLAREQRTPGKYTSLLECIDTFLDDGASMIDDARWLEEKILKITSNINFSGMDPMAGTRKERLGH